MSNKIKLDPKQFEVIEKNDKLIQILNKKTGHKINMLESKFKAEYDFKKEDKKEDKKENKSEKPAGK